MSYSCREYGHACECATVNGYCMITACAKHPPEEVCTTTWIVESPAIIIPTPIDKGGRMKRKTRWKQIGRAYMMRTGDLVCIGKRDEKGTLQVTVVEPECVETIMRMCGDGAFLFEWSIEKPKEGQNDH